jgi:hypothetical protein
VVDRRSQTYKQRGEIEKGTKKKERLTERNKERKRNTAWEGKKETMYTEGVR